MKIYKLGIFIPKANRLAAEETYVSCKSSWGKRHMKFDVITNYQTYREIMDELLSPINGDDLEADILVRLYQSKLVYLENLRTKCFMEINRKSETPFTATDYALIIKAVKETKAHLRQSMVLAISENLSNRKAV
jgi:hypothetical protein